MEIEYRATKNGLLVVRAFWMDSSAAKVSNMFFHEVFDNKAGLLLGASKVGAYVANHLLSVPRPSTVGGVPNKWELDFRSDKKRMENLGTNAF